MLYSLFFRNLALFYSVLNGVLVFKLSASTAAHVPQYRYRVPLYQYSYRQISVTIHRRIEHSTTNYVAFSDHLYWVLFAFKLPYSDG